MTSAGRETSTGRWWTPAPVLAAVGLVLFVAISTGFAPRFLASLRIAKPQAVTAGVPGATGGNGARPLQSMIGGMITKTVNVSLDEADEPAGQRRRRPRRRRDFPARLPRARTDSPAISVVGAHTIEMTAVDVAQLRTIFAEAGKTDVPLAEGVRRRLEGGVVRTPRARFGHSTATAHGAQLRTRSRGRCRGHHHRQRTTADLHRRARRRSGRGRRTCRRRWI